MNFLAVSGFKLFTLLCFTLGSFPSASGSEQSALPQPKNSSATYSQLEKEQPRGVWPVASPHIVIRPFEAPPTPYSAGHRGIDIAAQAGNPVFAPAGGVVSFAGVVVDRPIVSIRHPDGLITSLEPVATTLVAGDSVTTGQPIGTVASSTHCPVSCVHFGLRKNGQYVSPLLLLGDIPHARLLPLGQR